MIPQAFIDDLLDRVDIVDVIDRRVKLKKTGKNYSARCPFHQEKTPSFSVNPDKQFYYCFGCGAGGNALGFLMDYESLEFPAAVESLAAAAGVEVPRDEAPGAAAARQGRRNLHALMEEAAAFYRRQLREHPGKGRVVDYLKGRGLSGAIAKQFELGFAPPGRDNLLNALGGGDARRAQLLEAGLLVQGDDGRAPYDRFRDRLMFPIRDGQGRAIGFGGRILGSGEPKYLNSPETPIFHKGRELYGLYQARRAPGKIERIIVVEGYMDVVALCQHGIHNAAATLGTATSETHLDKIFRICPEVVFCFDGDAAGRRAAARAMEAALPAMRDGRRAKFLFLPEGEDPDSFVRSREAGAASGTSATDGTRELSGTGTGAGEPGKGAAAFNGLVAQAVLLEDYFFEALGDGLDVNSMAGRAALSQRAAPLLHKLPAGVYRQLMFQSLADRTGLPLQDLEAQLPPPSPSRTSAPAAPRPHTTGPRQRKPIAPPQDRAGNLAQKAIALILHHPAAAAAVQAHAEAIAQLAGSEAALLRDLLSVLRRRPELNRAALLGRWHGTQESALLHYLVSQEQLLPEAGMVEKELADTIELLLHPRKREPEAESGPETRDKSKREAIWEATTQGGYLGWLHRNSRNGGR